MERGRGELVPFFGSPGVGSFDEAFLDVEDPVDQPLPEDESLTLRELIHSSDHPFRVFVPLREQNGWFRHRTA